MQSYPELEPVVDPHKFDAWNNMALNLALVIWAVGLLVILGYFVKLATTGGSKNKYDFINRYEINLLWIASIILIVGGTFFVNANVTELTTLWIFVRVFTTTMAGFFVGVIIKNLLKFYYPFFIERRLKVLRYKPRISPKTGKPMKLLSEEEEDAHMDEGMIEEENVFSVDYDVWLDEESGYKQIEKYAGHLHAIQCPECNYQTFKVNREEVVKAPTATEEGELMKHYVCSYCGYKARKTVTLKVSTKMDESAAAATA
jgi:DNA-directed RNA polymerase subunit RPC12/RpoP